MRKFSVVAWLLPCILTAQPVPPTPSELIAKAMAAEKAQADRGWKYTYREDETQSPLNKNGTPGLATTRTYEHIMLEGSDYRKLLLIDGKPLDAKTQKKVDADLNKARAERKKNGLFHRSVSLGGIEVLGRLFDNKVTGEETVLGRKTWRMESQPKPGYKAANKEEEQALASRRMNWFDRQDGFLIQQDDFFVRTANGFQPGTIMSWEFTKVGEEWLPDTTTMRADVKFLPGLGARVNSVQHYYDYKRFTVDSTFTP